MGQKRKNITDEEQPDSKKVNALTVTATKSVVAADVDHEEGMDVEQSEMRKMVRSQNRKKKSGGFQSMGLSHAIFKGIMKKGYKVPTPIQRKTIPIILDGKDVVAMARTGSGKTAAFLIPMFERFKMHSSAGVRALILSPTRELALQTLKFSKELGKFTDIRAAAILGGDKMDDQFAALHENPDLIIATPGRLMHVLVEMNLKLQAVEYVVFDEADRLFEMGFQEQLHSIIARLPESRQTLLFSATLPKLLVEFAKAGLHDPTLIRLDVDSKLSDQLSCRPDEKTAALVYLLQSVIKQGEQTVVFVATKHHVEFLNLILAEAGIVCSYSYSALDQMARKLSVARFRNKVTNVMIVTDLAARGIDIPMLDNVINYNFPAKSKLFVHRVGRVARAGRSGTAYSLIAPEEMSYVIDLHLFLGRPLKYAEHGKNHTGEDAVYGRIPQTVIDKQDEKVRVWLTKTDIQSMLRVVSNGYKHYLKTRPAPSSESVKRVKQMGSVVIGYHPLFETNCDGVEIEQVKLLEAMKSYRPNTTIFEINSTNKTQASSIMKQKRLFHGSVISRKHSSDRPSTVTAVTAVTNENKQNLAAVTPMELEDTFSTIFAPKHREDDSGDYARKKKKRKLEKKPTVDEKNFIPYQPKDFQTEQGLGLGTSFENDARSAVLDFTGDDEKEMRRGRGRMIWDRKRKRFVRETGQERVGGKLKTESGNKIESGYKKNIYKDWLEKNKVNNTQNDSDDENDEQDAKHRPGRWGKQRGGHFGGRREHSGDEGGAVRGGHGRRGQRGFDGRGRGSQRGNKFRNELRDKSQIVKDRTKRADKQAYQAYRTDQKRGRGRGSGGRGRGSGGRGRGSGGRGRKH